jgi:hypothetical protein
MGNNYTKDFYFDKKGFRVYLKPMSSPIYRPNLWKTNLAQTKCKLFWQRTNEFTNLEATLWKNNHSSDILSNFSNIRVFYVFLGFLKNTWKYLIQRPIFKPSYFYNVFFKILLFQHLQKILVFRMSLLWK